MASVMQNTIRATLSNGPQGSPGQVKRATLPKRLNENPPERRETKSSKQDTKNVGISFFTQIFIFY